MINNFLKKIIPLVLLFGLAVPALAQGGNDFSVFVNWKNPLLKNTKTDETGQWYYDIQSEGFVEKNVDLKAIWVLEQVNILDDTDKKVFELGTYPGGTGKKFHARFPSCDNNGFNCPQLTASPVKPGYRYKTYFTDSLTNPASIQQEQGDGILSLPLIPSSIGNIRDYVSVSNLEFSKDSDGKNIYSLIVDVLKKDESSFDFSLVARKDNPDTKIEESTSFGLGNILFKELKPYNMTTAANSFDYKNARFYVAIKRNSKLVAEIPVALRTVYKDNDSTFNFNATLGNNPVQQDIKDNGIVSKACGYDIGIGGKGRNCEIGDFIGLIQRLIEYVFILLLPIVAIVFVYVGFLYMTSGGDSGKRTKAKDAIFNLIKGVVLILAAWLIVRTILTSLGLADEFFVFFAK